MLVDSVYLYPYRWSLIANLMVTGWMFRGLVSGLKINRVLSKRLYSPARLLLLSLCSRDVLETKELYAPVSRVTINTFGCYSRSSWTVINEQVGSIFNVTMADCFVIFSKSGLNWRLSLSVLSVRSPPVNSHHIPVSVRCVVWPATFFAFLVCCIDRSLVLFKCYVFISRFSSSFLSPSLSVFSLDFLVL